jgi:outer membrane cobalamin receptor
MNYRTMSLVSAIVGATVVGCVRQAEMKNISTSPNSTITEDEIVASRATNAYEAVSRLRGATFLAVRGKNSVDPREPPPEIHVYVDGVGYGGINSLRNIPASQVAMIRFYRGFEAETKFGNGNVAGVIEVLTH